MITNNEKQSTLISPTAKDFFQIWNELLEVAGKISERWDPATTNESDPGIVLLKVLTALADNLNYNIDKNILEAYMPSAAQEESMRKLCEMLGYDMKYYRSATTDVTIAYMGSAQDWQSTESGIAPLILPRFTQITNLDSDIIYTTTERAVFTRANTVATIPCIEGTLHFCEEDNDGIVTLNNIDDNFRYYLPQTYIAENGLFVYNVSDGVWSTEWRKVTNLNSHALKSYIYKFGYDSRKFLPYIQFPEDISALIADGLRIGYIVTSGVNGNISAGTLTTFTTPTEWQLSDSTEAQSNSYNKTGVEHTADEFKCTNTSAATNGADRESLNAAYNGFKKTIGTFDTLVTCRDYMNKIYQLTTSSTNPTPLVSNSIVSDIRDDINRAMSICSFDDFGIKYVDYAHSVTNKENIITDFVVSGQGDSNVTSATINNAYEATSATIDKTLKYINTYQGTNDISYWRGYKQVIADSDPVYSWGAIEGISSPAMNHFDLILYPFKTVQGLNTKNEYDGSFKYDNANYREISSELEVYKTISHKLNLPTNDEIICIKNYLRLNAKITTMTKVDNIEWKVILDNIKTAIYKAFNLRQLDFSEEIPFDDILDVIQKADANIKNVALEEPTLYTVVLTGDNREYFITYDADNVGNDVSKQQKEMKKKFTPEEKIAFAAGESNFWATKNLTTKELYNKLVLRNILAGRVELFNYNKDFSAEVNEIPLENDVPLIYPTDDNPITNIRPDFNLETAIGGDSSKNPYTLQENQIIQFSAPNFRTVKTYPSYVNYYLQLAGGAAEKAIPATFNSLTAVLTANANALYIQAIIENLNTPNNLNILDLNATQTSQFDTLKSSYPIIFESKNSSYQPTTDYVGWYSEGSTQVKRILDATTRLPIVGTKTYYTIKLDPTTFNYWNTWFIENNSTPPIATDCDGLYRAKSGDTTCVPGYLIDENKTKYILVTKLNTTPINPLGSLFVPIIEPNSPRTTGKGKDAVANKIAANTEYKLQSDECLYINYTDANTSTADMGENDTAATLKTTSTVINDVLKEGTIIKPNFDLEDSSIKAQHTSYSKKTGFTFPDSSIPGMFSIGANEQIEVREPVVVYVYDETNTGATGPSPIYVYFNLKDEIPDEQGRIYFLTKDGPDSTRILNEGEYFWYTDKNKQLLTYCGPGTEIENHTGGGIYKRDTATKITTEDILEQGLSIVPWITIPGLYMTKPNDETANGKYIKWSEYQYITLTADDTLLTLDPTDDDHKINIPDGCNQEPRECTSATYQFKDSLTPESLPTFTIKGITWKVRTKLEVNSTPANGQKLNVGDSITLEYKNTSPTIIAGNGDEDVTFKTNYVINSTLDNINTTYSSINEKGELEELNNFKVKVFNQKQISITTKDTGAQEENPSIPLLLNNTQQYYTSVPFNYLPENADQNYPYFKLYCTIPDETTQFGLIMFYYKTTAVEENPNNCPRISIIYDDTDHPAKLYNSRTINELIPGINVIEIAKSCIIQIKPAYSFQAKDDLIIFSPLDIIDEGIYEGRPDKGLNLDILKYYLPKSSPFPADPQTPAEQLLADIHAADEEGIFYYNAIIDNSARLDLNIDAGETMQTERIWYDYNNVNNKFVVSEIDSDYLDTGITLARTSSK